MPIKSQIIIALLVHSVAFGQNKLSPHLQKSEFKELAQSFLSISVKDSSLFKEKYAGKILIHRKHHNSNCFVISITDDKALEEMKKDSNILFVDSHRSIVEESVLDFVNTSFNRITSEHNF